MSDNVTTWWFLPEGTFVEDGNKLRRVESERMKWEYLIIEADKDFVPEFRMNLVGREGWELVAVDNGVAYFKRELREPLTVTKITNDSMLSAVFNTPYDD